MMLAIIKQHNVRLCLFCVCFTALSDNHAISAGVQFNFVILGTKHI